MRLPLVMRLRVHDQRHRFSLWVPLFIFLPLLLVLGAVLLPFFLVAAVLLVPFGLVRLALVVPYLAVVLGRLRGLQVDVDNGSRRVFISFQ